MEVNKTVEWKLNHQESFDTKIQFGFFPKCREFSEVESRNSVSREREFPDWYKLMGNTVFQQVFIACLLCIRDFFFFFFPNLKFASWNLNCSCWKQSTSVTRLHCISEGNGRPYRKRNRSRDSGLGWVERINRVSPVGLIVKMTFVEVVEVLRNCYIFFVLPYCMRQDLQ